MPKLLFFIPCERVIVAREGPISLITVLEGMNLNMPIEEYDSLPDDATAPISWHVVTKWIANDDEERHPWEQRLQVITPNGRISTELIMVFDLAENPVGIRNIAQINGFAIKPLGDVTIRLSLRRAGEDDTAWQEIATCPIKLQNPQP